MPVLGLGLDLLVVDLRRVLVLGLRLGLLMVGLRRVLVLGLRLGMLVREVAVLTMDCPGVGLLG